MPKWLVEPGEYTAALMPAAIDVLKGQACHVMRVLGAGHRERIYHNAMITALNRRVIPHRSEVACPIWFMGECIGIGRADLVIDDLVVEIKANKLPPSETSAQLRKYIHSLTKSERKAFRGVVINFNQKTGQVDVLEERSTAAVQSAVFQRSIATRRSATATMPVPPMVKRCRGAP
jgi:GxxExxY protein